MPEYHYYLRDTWQGALERPAYTAFERVYVPSSLAYLCPCCGEVWAKVWAAGVSFTPVYARCERCPSILPASPAGHPTHFPGSMLSTYLLNSGFDLPPALWKREMEIHLSSYESTQ